MTTSTTNTAARELLPCPFCGNEPQLDDCENMIDPVQIEVSIPGQLGSTVRFVERSWLYPNN